MAKDKSLHAEKPTEASLKVKIFSPSKTYFEGEALSVSASNKAGKFDILPLHHNFITLLEAGTVEINTPKHTVEKVEIRSSLLHLADDHVTIFTDV